MNNLRAHLSILGANIIYGINYTVAKDVMPDYITPFGFVFCRILGALILFWSVSFIQYEKIEKKDLLLLATCGFFGVFANQLMFLYGLDNTTPINASIIMISNPILVLIASAIILKNRITGMKVTGITLGIIGALLLLLLKQDFSFGSEYLLGDLFIFLNAAAYGVYLVLVFPLMKKYNPITVLKWVFTFGFIFVIPFSIQDFSNTAWHNFSLKIWLEFSFVIIGTTFFAYLLNIYGLKRLNPSVVSTYIYLQPLFAALIAIWAGKDAIDGVKIIAALLIFSGVYLVNKSSLPAH